MPQTVIPFEKLHEHPIWPAMQEARRRISGMTDAQLRAAGVSRESMEDLLNHRVDVKLGSFRDMRANPASIHSSPWDDESNLFRNRYLIVINEWFCDLPHEIQVKVLLHEFGHAAYWMAVAETVLLGIHSLTVAGASISVMEWFNGINQALSTSPDVSALANFAVGATTLAVGALCVSRALLRHVEHFCDRFSDITMPEVNYEQEARQWRVTAMAYKERTPAKPVADEPLFSLDPLLMHLQKFQDFINRLFPTHPDFSVRRDYSAGRLDQAELASRQEAAVLHVANVMEKLCLTHVADYLRRNTAMPLSHWGVEPVEADKAVVAATMKR